MSKAFWITTLKSARLIVLISSVVVAFSTSSSAQNAFDTGTPAESRGGSALISSFAQDKIETVNLANGNLNLSIPLVTIGGRGSASYTVALGYNSKLWTGEQSFDSANQITVSGATYDDVLLRMPNIIPLGSGWFILRGPTIKSKKVEIDWITGTCHPDGDRPAKVLTKVWLILPDGSEVELRDRASQGEPSPTSLFSSCVPNLNDRDRGRIWYSVDGSAITYVTDADNGVVLGQVAGYVFLADGTRLRINNGGKCTNITDSNGNVVSINYQAGNMVTYTDQLSRQVTLQQTATGASVTIFGYGVAARTITIDTGLIGAADGSGNRVNLRADDRSVTFPIINGDFIDIGTHALSSPHTDLFNMSDVTYFMATSIDQQSVVTKLNLLDGRSLQFRYNKFGELAEIVYPGGGISQIDYVAFGASICDQGGFIRGQLNRRVSQRRLLSDGASVDATWTYIRDTATVDGSTYPRVVVEAHQGSVSGPLLMSEKHYFLKLDKQYLNCTAFRGNHGDGYEYWDNAKEFRKERTTGNGTEKIKRIWEQRTPVLWGGVTASEQPTNDPRIVQEDRLVENGKMKRVEYEYDGGERITNAFNNVTKTSEYDFGTDGNPGSLLRQTMRTYVTNLNGYCYLNLLGTDITCPTDNIPTNIAKVIHKRRLLATETIKDGGGNVEAYTEFEYDNYSSDLTHAPIQSNSSMVQYDGTWFTPFAAQNQPRGNVTGIKRLISGNPPPGSGTYATSYSQYDEAGNVVKAIDPRGNTTTISYADNFDDGDFIPESGATGPNGPTFAFPTTSTNALLQVTKSQYDYTSGVVTGVKDANGVIMKTEHVDPYDRPTRVTAALGLPEQTKSEMSYPTASANQTTVSNQLDSARWLARKTTYDGFGRPVTTNQAEDGNHASVASFTISSKRVYDALGRVKFSTNPYRSTSATTDGWTRTTYDLAGRVVEVATFAGAPDTQPPDNGTNANWTGSVITTYSSEATTVIDQAGRKRRSILDGLGRLIRVDEPDINGNLDDNASPPQPLQPTYYTYDARGNLRTVTQGSQTRTFYYDLLSRLTQANNPENGTINYTYYENSSLRTRQDARLITTTYNYDVVNRVTSRTYSDTATPPVYFYYDSQLPPGAPTFTRGSSTGRLVGVCYGGSTASTGTYTGYDSLGRTNVSVQQTDSQNYMFSYGYDLAGNLTSETYPSGRIIQTEYDNAGRMVTVKRQSTEMKYASGIGYTAHGAITTMQLGNGRSERTTFNTRLQPTQTKVDSNILGSNLLQLDYGYGTTTANNGNIISQTITVPNPTGGGPIAMTQNYIYDSLNRLQSANEIGGGGWTQNYDYDRWGNRAVRNTSNYIPNTRQTLISTSSDLSSLFNQTTNRITASTDYSYDPAGNLVSMPNKVAGANTMAYDGENRQIKFNSTNQNYFYDGDGHRVKKTIGGDTSIFVYNVMGRLIAEYTSATPAAGDTSYLTTDHLESTRLVTDSGGNVKARYDYVPFGEEIGSSVGSRSSIPGYGAVDSTRQKFTQKERDSESGLDYFLARYYSAAEGRFLSTDLVRGSTRTPQTWNLYAYVLNNPLRFIDPTGMWHYEEVEIDGNKHRIAVGDYDNEYVKGVGYWNSKTREWGKYHDWTPGLSSFSRLVLQDLALREKASMQAIGLFAGGTAVGGGLGGGAAFLGGVSLGGSSLTTLGLSSGGELVGLTGYGATTVATLNSLASSGGPTIEVVTLQTQAPAAGQALSTATGNGAEALANSFPKVGGQLFRAEIPKALMRELERVGLAQRLTHASGATEIHFLPQAARFITQFFK